MLSDYRSAGGHLRSGYAALFPDDIDSTTIYSVCYDSLVQTVRTTKNKQVAVDCLHAAAILLYINDSPNEVEDDFMSLLNSILTNPKPTYPSACVVT